MLPYIKLEPDRLSEILERLKEACICVLGDVCVDLYWYADMKRSRLSRETPHFPLPVVREEYFPGGCGNVMNNVRTLGVKRLIPISVVGDDWRGFLLTRWFEQNGIDTSCIFKSGSLLTPCYCKPMRCGISDVVYEDPRLDFENFAPLETELEEKILQALDRTAREADVIAVSDQYRFGVMTERVRQKLAELSAGGMTVVVDSRENASAYHGVILKPNEVEARALADAEDGEDYPKIAQSLYERNRKPVIVTLGERGAVWCDADGPRFAPTRKEEPPVDIVGAGDAFLAAVCCAMAAGAEGGEAITLGNLAAGVTVKKIGTTGTAGPEEILRKYRESQI